MYLIHYFIFHLLWKCANLVKGCYKVTSHGGTNIKAYKFFTISDTIAHCLDIYGVVDCSFIDFGSVIIKNNFYYPSKVFFLVSCVNGNYYKILLGFSKTW